MSHLIEYQFRDIMKGFYDGPHATPDPSDDGPIFLGIKNIHESGGIDFSDIRHISEDEYAKWTKRVVPQKDDLVFSYEATLHRYALIPEGFRGCLGRRMALIRVNKLLVNEKYLYYYFLSAYWRAFIETVKVSGATVDRISISDFPNYKISLPTLAVQEKIASLISAYDELIENNNQRIKLLEQMAEEIYKEWFVRLRFPGYETVRFFNEDGKEVKQGEVGALPEGWEISRLETVCDFQMGQSPPSEFYNEDKVGLAFHQGVTNFTSRFPNHASYCTDLKRIAHEGEILLSVRAPVGRINIADREIVIGRGLCSIKHKNDLQNYCYYLLKEIFKKEDSFGNGAVFNAVSKNDLLRIKATKPSIEICKKFQELIKPVDDEIKVLTQKNQLLQQTRDLLLPRLLSGKLSVEHLIEEVVHLPMAAEPEVKYKE